jgi:hypothetical protein
MGHGTGLDNVEKREFLTLPELELRPLCRPARSQSLYRLRLVSEKMRFVGRMWLYSLLTAKGRRKLRKSYKFRKYQGLGNNAE